MYSSHNDHSEHDCHEQKYVPSLFDFGSRLCLHLFCFPPNLGPPPSTLVAVVCNMAESFDLTEQQRAVVRSWHGGDAEEEVLFLHRQSTALIAHFITKAQHPWFIWWRLLTNGVQPGTSARHFMTAIPPQSVLTTRMLATYNTGHISASVFPRVQVYMISGTMIGIAGVGEGDDILTLPNNFKVGQALLSRHWIRKAEASDETSALCVPLDADLTPTSILYKDGSLADVYEPIGKQGDRVTAIVQPGPKKRFYKRRHDVSRMKTPSTPSSASDSSEQ